MSSRLPSGAVWQNGAGCSFSVTVLSFCAVVLARAAPENHGHNDEDEKEADREEENKKDLEDEEDEEYV